MAFTHWKLFQYPSLMTRNAVTIGNFWPPLRTKLGVVSHACHPRFSRGGWVPMSLGFQCAQWVFHITFGISLMIPELRSAGCLRKGEPTWTRKRASQFWTAQSSLPRDRYWDCGDSNPYASWRHILIERICSPSCVLCYRHNAEVRRIDCRESGLSGLNSKFLFVPESFSPL